MGLQYYNINDVQSELSNDEQVEWLIKAFAHNPEVLQRAAQQARAADGLPAEYIYCECPSCHATGLPELFIRRR